MLLTLRMLWSLITQGSSNVYILILSGALLALSFGLIKERKWACRGSAFVVLLIAIIFPCGILSPFSASDYLAA